MNRALAAALAGVALTAAAPASRSEEVPASIAARTDRGAFAAGDHGWLRGAFAGSSEAEQREWAEISAFVDSRQKANAEKVRARLTALDPGTTQLEPGCYGEEPCATLAAARDAARSFAGLRQFEAGMAEARPLAAAYLFAVRQAEEAVRPPVGTPLGERLVAATIGEQMLRVAFGWGSGAAADAPPLSRDGRAAMRLLLLPETAARDRRATAGLKRIVAEHGWPSISRAGERGSNAAWLLVQHADEDPVFQLEALRLMEPLAKRGDVNRRNYAYLYDRVMLKLSGRQLYGTQFHCVAGEHEPQPVADEAGLDVRRTEAGLEPLADYRRRMEATFGASC